MALTHDADLTQKIIGLAMRVHTRLGPGLLENVYERCLCHEFDRNEIPYMRQVSMPLDYEGVLLDCGYRADLIVRNEVLLDLKSVEHILPLHEAQLLTYLRLSRCQVGLLLNFNTVSLKHGIRRRVLSRERQSPGRACARPPIPYTRSGASVPTACR
jgi:GxxExxY protein